MKKTWGGARARETSANTNPLQSNMNSTWRQAFPTRKWDRKLLLRCAALPHACFHIIHSTHRGRYQTPDAHKKQTIFPCKKILFQKGVVYRVNENITWAGCVYHLWAHIYAHGESEQTGGQAERQEKCTQQSNAVIPLPRLQQQQFGKVFNFDVRAGYERRARVSELGSRNAMEFARKWTVSESQVYTKHMSQSCWITKPGNPFQFRNRSSDSSIAGCEKSSRRNRISDILSSNESNDVIS